MRVVANGTWWGWRALVGMFSLITCRLAVPIYKAPGERSPPIPTIPTRQDPMLVTPHYSDGGGGMSTIVCFIARSKSFHATGLSVRALAMSHSLTGSRSAYDAR